MKMFEVYDLFDKHPYTKTLIDLDKVDTIVVKYFSSQQQYIDSISLHIGDAVFVVGKQCKIDYLIKHFDLALK